MIDLQIFFFSSGKRKMTLEELICIIIYKRMSVFTEEFYESLGNQLSITLERPVSTETLRKCVTLVLNLNTQNTPSITRKQTVSNSKTCEYILRRGTRNGELCGKTAKCEFDEKWYCGSEKKDGDNDTIYTGHIRTVRLNASKQTSAPKSKPSIDPDEKVKKLLEMTATKRTKVRKHPIYGVVYHPPTMIVVDINNHKALGSLQDDGSVVCLTKQQKMICDSNNWDYDRGNVVTKEDNDNIEVIEEDDIEVIEEDDVEVIEEDDVEIVEEDDVEIVEEDDEDIEIVEDIDDEECDFVVEEDIE